MFVSVQQIHKPRLSLALFEIGFGVVRVESWFTVCSFQDACDTYDTALSKLQQVIILLLVAHTL